MTLRHDIGDRTTTTGIAIVLLLILAGATGCERDADAEPVAAASTAAASPDAAAANATSPDAAAADTDAAPRAAEDAPRAWIEAYLAGAGDPDDLFAQARAADGFEVRPVLVRAIDGDEAGLRELLLYTGRATPTGAASEDHAAVLVALLEVWRDEPFAAVLSTTPPAAVGATQRLLLKGGAERERFPATFAVPSGPAKP